MFAPCFVVHCFVSFLVCSHLDGEERAGRFTVFVSLATIIVLRPFLTVPSIGLQCVIVVIPDHTHLILGHVLNL